LKTLQKRQGIRLPRSAYEEGQAFSITITTAKRYPWFKVHCDLADTSISLILALAQEREAVVFAWCIMPDHIHLLLQDNNILDLVRLFKGRLTPEARRLEPVRTFWQRSFYDHALRKEEALEDVARYIWENPARAGIVDRASAYPWSGSLVWPNWKEFVD
jgi:REP element-mobilizing transposase RayT